MPITRLESDVVVVGAGIAGLVAATEVVAAGHEAVVVEARDRVGGRTWNTEFLGQPNELGGQWIAPYQTAVRALCDDLAIELFHAYREGDRTYVDADGNAHRYSGHAAPLGTAAERDYAQATAKLDEIVADLDPARPWEHPRAGELDAITFETWLQQELHDDVARDMLRAYLAGGYMTKPSTMFSPLAGLWVIAGAGSVDNLFEPDLCLHSRVVGGSQLIAIRLAERLGDRVLTGRPVRTIRWSADGVAVEAGDTTVRARQAIVAVPINLTGAIRFEPSLPSWRYRLEQHVSQGSVIKVLSVYDQPFWREDGLSGEGFAPYSLVREVYDNSPPGGEPGVLVSFLSGERAEVASRLGAEERRRLVLDDLAVLIGDEARSAVDYVEIDWSAEEWTRGAYSATFGPGGLSRFGPDVRRPIGPIHWATSDIAGLGNLHMEGAVRSGRDAAEAVVSALP